MRRIAAPHGIARTGVNSGRMRRWRRREVTCAVVDPHNEAAIGRRDEVEVAVAVDVGGYRLVDMNVIAQSDEAFEGGDVDLVTGADVGPKRNGSRRGGRAR